MQYGTKVRNPSRHSGRTGYSQCSGCKLWYTSMGIGRHWSKCKAPGMQEKQRKLREETMKCVAERLVG